MEAFHTGSEKAADFFFQLLRDEKAKQLNLWPIKMMVRYRNLGNLFFPFANVKPVDDEVLVFCLFVCFCLSDGHPKVPAKFHWVKSDLLDRRVELTHLLLRQLLLVKTKTKTFFEFKLGKFYMHIHFALGLHRKKLPASNSHFCHGCSVD